VPLHPEILKLFLHLAFILVALVGSVVRTDSFFFDQDNTNGLLSITISYCANTAINERSNGFRSPAVIDQSVRKDAYAG
jgi:hypothetical protein